MHLTVVGTPTPQGSKRHVGKGVLIESAGQKLKDWRADVRASALPHIDQRAAPGVPVHIRIAFRLQAPKALPKRCHGGPHPRRPDLDKLIRSTLDALTGIAWADDSQVARISATKAYAAAGEHPGATITIELLPT